MKRKFSVLVLDQQGKPVTSTEVIASFRGISRGGCLGASYTDDAGNAVFLTQGELLGGEWSLNIGGNMLELNALDSDSVWGYRLRVKVRGQTFGPFRFGRDSYRVMLRENDPVSAENIANDLPH